MANRTAERDQSCRGVLADLAAQGRLVSIDKPVDPAFEVSAVLSLVDDRAAVVLRNVKGSDLAIFGNVLSSPARIAEALDCAPGEVQEKLLSAIRNPVKPELVANAPVQEVVETDRLFDGLPFPHFFEKETGAYVSAGLLIARDPETGLGNASYARLKILGNDRAMIGIAPNHHLAMMARKAEAMGQPLPFAVVLGAHPALQLAGCLYLGFGEDEMECAGALLGEPVRMIRAKTIDLDVPAEAEVVIEGHIHIGTPIAEGLVSEYHGMYEDYGNGALATFQCVTRRRDAMLQVIEPGYHMEHIYLGAVPIAAGLRAALSRHLNNVCEVAVTAVGGGRTDVVVALRDPRPGQARRAMAICWGAVSIVKRVTVVDADVDPWDQLQVERARIARSRAERDIVIIPGMTADRSEAQEDNFLVTKIGYDATCRASDRKEGHDEAVPPAEALARMRAMLTDSHPGLLD